MAPDLAPSISLEVDGRTVSCSSEGSLLDVLRADGGFASVKDGCSPQGQCGCCTILVDGVARVSCVTPVRRVAGRSITTIDGVDEALRVRLLRAFDATAASQCGFCTPGILMRLCGLARRGVPSEAQVRTALGAHLCRCTGFQPIVEAALVALDPSAQIGSARDPDRAAERATLESGTAQHIGDDVMMGTPGFAIDTAPPESLIAVAVAGGGYVVAERYSEITGTMKKVQGRNSTVPLRAPVPLPDVVDPALVLQTTFVEPAYVEPDSSWCRPGEDPAIPFANAGAFGAKRNSLIMREVKQLARDNGRSVLATWSREEVVRRGAKRPPLALVLRSDGTGVLRIGRTPGSDSFDELLDRLEQAFPSLEREVVEISGPRLGVTHRGAVFAEVLAAYATLGADPAEPISLEAPNGARATIGFVSDGEIDVVVNAGRPLCAVTLESYVIGAVHQGLGMVESEGIAVDDAGSVQDLTIRSFGILTASQMPQVNVVIKDDDTEPSACGVAVMAATMAASWLRSGLGSRWPVNREVL